MSTLTTRCGYCHEKIRISLHTVTTPNGVKTLQSDADGVCPLCKNPIILDPMVFPYRDGEEFRRGSNDRLIKPRTYRHWLKLSMAGADKDILRGLADVERARQLSGYSISVFRSEDHLFNYYFLVEAPDNYDDLEIAVNSLSSPIKRLAQRPADATLIALSTEEWLTSRQNMLQR